MAKANYWGNPEGWIAYVVGESRPVLILTALMLLFSVASSWGCGKQEAVTPPPKVEVIIYTDFQCHNCADFYFNVEEKLLERYGNTSEVRLEARPINGLGYASMLAGEAALCARDQGWFWGYSDALFSAWRQAGEGVYSEERMLNIAIALDLNIDAFRSCLESGAKEAEVEDNRRQLLEAGESEVPIIFINGSKIVGVNPLQTYVDVVDQLLSQ